MGFQAMAHSSKGLLFIVSELQVKFLLESENVQFDPETYTPDDAMHGSFGLAFEFHYGNPINYP